ncbi:YicC/YloC family endoribonuclease [Falsibacillus albus]|uniref:YicC family protein n=1 Tax=Falsibacillus albus TaxID=2478915 RepID=A0A3L7JYC0_9BACI|nr:YicC/YloC family endoribonuclease [Falsibacillus albus]RLQ95797.1 YicC family protein [Falsibacillus albus]
MVMSMTGFGRGRAESSQYAVTVEMKSVNHRFCEFNIRMPRQLLSIEEKIKKNIGDIVKRGRTEVFIAFEGEGLVKRKLHIDWELLEDYYQLVNKIKDTFNVHTEIDLKDLINRSDFISIEEMEEENEMIDSLVLEAVYGAVQKLSEMRAAEGQALKKDLLHQLRAFNLELKKLKEYAPAVTEKYKARLEKKVSEWMNGEIDEARIMTELAIFADKSDISEEMTRLDSHIAQFRQALDQKQPIGRKLDFMIQEMNREVNTIGSKANDSNISHTVVELKTYLEKMREQVQNIE